MLLGPQLLLDARGWGGGGALLPALAYALAAAEPAGFVSSGPCLGNIDYYNVLYVGLPLKTVQKLQLA